MNINDLIILAGVVPVVLILGIIVFKKRPRKLRVEKFAHDWRELQGLCKDKTTWPDAILYADTLLDKALKRRKFKGKSMGERIVSAQRKISNNDQLWFAHNLAKKVKSEPAFKLKEADVKAALIGFRQALRDLGALTSDSPQAKESEK